MLIPFLTIFFISSGLLSYEIFLIRILAIIKWGHYAYMVVSLAMLGLGFSGVLLVFASEFFRQFRNILILIGCFLFSLSVPVCFYLGNKVPVNYLYLIWDIKQFLYITVQFFLYSIPFIIASTIIALFFTCFKEKEGKIYGFNLMGSAAGVFLTLGVMFVIPPEKYLTVPGILGLIAGLLWSIYVFTGGKRVISICSALSLISLSLFLFPRSLLPYLCQYKGLSGLLRLPGIEIVHTYYSPAGVIHLCKGEHIRLTSGLSLKFTGNIPEHKALTVDGGAPVPVYSIKNGLGEYEFFDWSIFSSVYHLSHNPSVLILGAGGGADVLMACYYRSASVKVLEIDPEIIKANHLKEIILKENLPVQIILKEARGYLSQTGEKFDIIFMGPSGSISTAASGVYAQNEDYLNTVEAYSIIYQRLSPKGIFSVSRWVKVPPRDGIKLFATAFSVLKRAGVKYPEKHLAIIRNWDVITLLVKKTPFTEKEIGILKNFCDNRSFDISYLPGIDESLLNRYHIISEETYYLAAKSIIENPDFTGDFFIRYPFHILPATDNRPYFSNFFRWRALPHLLRTMKKEWIPFVELGYITVLITFLQAILFGILLIILPLSRSKLPERYKSWKFRGYFSLLGFSYMTLEISLIQRFILFLHHPVYSVSIVIVSFLLVSGIGSYLSERIKRQYIFLIFLIIVLTGTLYILFLDRIFSLLNWAHLPPRILFSFVVIFPLALFMGMPFPLGIRKAIEGKEKVVGYAWGYNGFFSVFGSVLVPVLSNYAGFTITGISGCTGYLAAMILFLKNFI